MTSEGEENFFMPSTGSNPATGSTSTTDGSLTCKKRKLTSIVWNEFEKVIIDGQDYAICKHCKSKLKTDSKNRTKHLHVHLDRCIKRRNVDIKQQFLAIERKGYGKVQIGGFTFDQDISREKLARAIILHEFPLSIVDHAGFRDFASSLQPLFKMVSHNTIKDDIMKIYEFEKGKMSSYLEKLETRMAITTDMWTSNQKKGYMAITVHYIDESWLLHHHIVRFVYVPPPHTKEVLSDVLLDFLLDWNMDRKLSTITVDNCSSNDGMIDILLEKLSSSGSLLLNGKIFHMRCAAHVLNLIVKEGLDVIRVEIEKIRESVAYWSATPSRVEKFEDAARQLHLPCNKKLCLDCKTRWNSTYLMLSIAITYKDVFPRLKQREKLYTTVPSEEEWNLAREICERLKLFYNITKLFSGRNYPTANTFFIKVCEIKEALYDWLICSNEVVSTMASSMLEKFDKYWSGCHIVMAIAVVLDPRYKMKILEFYFPIMYGSEASSEIGKFCQLCYDLLSEYQSKSKMGQQTSSHGASSVSNLFELTYDEQDPLSKFDLFVHSTSEEGHAKSELDYYLEETVLPRISDFDVLSWWKTNGGKLTIMDEDDESLLLIKVVFFGKEGISADLIAVNEDVGAACWGISVYISPMPLGIIVAGARLLKNKGDGKQKREGPCVGTKGFRAPEACVLLLGATYYGTAVDLWSTGCILAELYAGKPIMPGRTEVGSGLRGSAMLVVLVEQLHKIFKLCGSPSEDYWRKSKLPHATIFKPQQPYRRCVAETFKDFPTPALGPMETLLSIDPADRGSPASALKSEFFTVKPLPCDPSSLPKYPHSKEFDAKVRDEEARRDDENASPEVALEFLAKHCQWAVVTLGSNRCLGKCGRERHIDVDMYITHLKLYAHLLHIAVGGCCTVDNCYRVLHCGHHLNGHWKFNYLNVLYLRDIRSSSHGSFSWASEANLFSAAGGMNKEACSQVESGTNPTAFPSIVSEENLEWEF
ncbi:hypothetical protein VitviT2T_015431 [Vitis vinifera]|uniref:Protein kinase domain-containing protein n=1 Tax=Vitis vinifera TaxID=29760 RepID=A0ABY9CP28_VITVI|nr:hypothetical protein VitviT2T_015431 [Vitis vinifera]